MYQYLRVVQGRSNDDAKDLTQDFFAWLVGRESFHRFDRTKGSFRNFLKTLLRGFVGNLDRTANRIKRGGGIRTVPLEEVAGSLPADPTSDDPDKEFDATWAAELATEAIRRVRERLLAGKHPEMFRAFEAYALSGRKDPPTYAEVASRLGMKETDVRNHLYTVRESIRMEIRASLVPVTSDDRELEEEYRALFGL